MDGENYQIEIDPDAGSTAKLSRKYTTAAEVNQKQTMTKNIDVCPAMKNTKTLSG